MGGTSWCLFQVLASVVPRRSSSAMGAAWRSSVVGYLLIWGDATPVAAETSVRGRSGRSDDNTKSKTKTKTNNPPRAPAGGLAQRRVLTGYVMDDDSIRTAVAAWFADQSAAEATYGHISTWETSGVTDMSQLFIVLQRGHRRMRKTRLGPNDELVPWVVTWSIACYFTTRWGVQRAREHGRRQSKT